VLAQSPVADYPATPCKGVLALTYRYSQVTSLPRGFSHRTLLVAGAGVTATVER
jgi:hypothetical protein